MELKLDLSYEQLIKLILQLPKSKLVQLRKILDGQTNETTKPLIQTDFQKLLLSGPVMNENQYQRFEENRKRFNEWRIEWFCLDTSVLIKYYRKTDKSRSFLYELSQTYSNFMASVVTEFEIYIGSDIL